MIWQELSIFPKTNHLPAPEKRWEKVFRGFEDGIVTSSLVLSEIAWTLLSYYKFSREKVILAIRSILNIKGLKIIDEYQPITAMDIFEKFGIKFIDSFIASIPQIFDKKWVIVSYDKEFDKLDVLRKEPSISGVDMP